MTPAIVTLQKAKLSFQLRSYTHHEGVTDFGNEAATALGVDPLRMFKTLVVQGMPEPKKPCLALLPVAMQLDLKKLARALGSHKADLYDPQMAEKLTGYVLGGISPIGCRKQLPVYIDESLLTWESVFVSAGKRGLQLELAPRVLIEVLQPTVTDIAT